MKTLNNLKTYDTFIKINENFDDVARIVALGIIAAPVATWLGWAGVMLIRNFFDNRKFNKESKKIYDIFNKYKDDSVIKPILLEYSKLSHLGEEESDGSKQEHYSEKRLNELKNIVHNRLKELMSDKEYQLFQKYRSFIVNYLKGQFNKENPEEYRKYTNYVPLEDKDTTTDKFLEDASDFFDEGYKARNWRDSVKHVINQKWIIRNDNIILEDMEEEDDKGKVYLDPITNEFIWEITEESFEEGYHERNFREFLAHMITEKRYKISKKELPGEEINDTSTFDNYRYKSKHR